MSDMQQQPRCTLSPQGTGQPHQPHSHGLLFQQCHKHYQQPSACTYTTPSRTYHTKNCTCITNCIYVSPTPNSNTTNPLLWPSHTSAPLDCAQSTYNKLTTNPSMLQHQVCLHSFQQQSPPEPRIVTLPSPPPCTHLTNQSHHSIHIKAPLTLNPTMTTMTRPLHNPTGQPSISMHHVDLQIFHAKPSIMPSTLHSIHCLNILSRKLLLDCWIAFSTVSSQGSMQQGCSPCDQRDHHKIHQVHA
jgi:hypothetical protein